MNIHTPHKVKCEMVTQDGEIWLVTHQHYLSELRTGKLVDGPGLEGTQFRIVRKENENENADRPIS